MSYIDSVKFYVEFCAEPSPDFKANTILATLFSKIHGSLLQSKACCGISFPKYSNKGLGTLLRLHGTREDLDKVVAVLKIGGLQHHLQRSDILEIPSEVKFAIFKRMHVHDKSMVRRIGRRRQLRGEDIESDKSFNDFCFNKPNAPYLIYHSVSTGQSLSFFINKEELNSKSMVLQKASFNNFGLCADNASYVPLF